jgi:hypothetical protein
LKCTAADKVLGPRSQERIEVKETAEAMQIEEPAAHMEPALLPTPRVSFFDHDQQVFNDAFRGLETQRTDLERWVIEWVKLQTERGVDTKSKWYHPPISFREDNLNPVNDWSIRLAFLQAKGCGREVTLDERRIERYEFAVRRMNDYTMTNYHWPSTDLWYRALWSNVMHRLDSAIITAKQSINTVREAVDYASHVLTSFNVFPAEPGNSSDDMQFRLFTNTLNTFDLKSKWTSFESHWERFIGQVSKLGAETKGWPPDGAPLGELLDSLRPGFG